MITGCLWRCRRLSKGRALAIQDLDLNYLKTLGPIQTVTQEEIFGY